MATTSKTKKIVLTEKEYRRIISGKLDKALQEYREEMGTKNFVERIKRATKIFSYELAKIARKESKKAEKTGKKA